MISSENSRHNQKMYYKLISICLLVLLKILISLIHWIHILSNINFLNNKKTIIFMRKDTRVNFYDNKAKNSWKSLTYWNYDFLIHFRKFFRNYFLIGSGLSNGIFLFEYPRYVLEILISRELSWKHEVSSNIKLIKLK
jgi:hypothetical protein